MARNKTKTPVEPLTINTIEQLKAIADPLRQQLLHEFAKQPATTKQVAVSLGYQPTRLYHHVAKLEKSGLIRLVETRPVRGATEKYYAATAPTIKIDHQSLAGTVAKKVGQSMYLNVIDGVWTNIRNDIAGVLEETGDDVDCMDEIVFLQAELDVDKDMAADLRGRMFDMLQEIDDEAQERAAKGSGKRRKYRVTVGWHPRASGS